MPIELLANVAKFRQGLLAPSKNHWNQKNLSRIFRKGVLLRFGSYGFFRAWPAYKYTVEHSVYVHKDHRGGLGRKVMQELIAAARENDVHAMLGGIDAANAGSIALHEQLGFRHVGTLSQVGFKFGHWLDLAFYQLLLDTPAHPVDG